MIPDLSELKQRFYKLKETLTAAPAGMFSLPCPKDPVTTDVTGPLQGQGADHDSDWKSGASDLVMESEIWWTVLFRQQSIFLTLSSLLKEPRSDPFQGRSICQKILLGVLSSEKNLFDRMIFS